VTLQPFVRLIPSYWYSKYHSNPPFSLSGKFSCCYNVSLLMFSRLAEPAPFSFRRRSTFFFFEELGFSFFFPFYPVLS